MVFSSLTIAVEGSVLSTLLQESLFDAKGFLYSGKLETKLRAETMLAVMESRTLLLRNNFKISMQVQVVITPYGKPILAGKGNGIS